MDIINERITKKDANKNTVNILLVDDDHELLRTTKQIIEAENGFNIEPACSVQEAIAKLAQKKYDVIVSDYEMQVKNGLQFLEELNGAKNKTPFILFTGKGREEVAIKALNLGAGGYVNKHGDPATVFGELAHCIRQNVEKKRAETALIESEERLKAIVQNAPIGIATSNADGQFTSANSTFCNILGYTEEEIQKLTFKDLTYPDDIPESISKMEELSKGKIQFFEIEKRYIRKDGTIIYGKATISAIRDQQGNPCLFIAELEDITESKKAKEALTQERDKFNAIAENVGAGITIVGKDYRIIYANKLINRICGNVEGELCYTVLNKLNDICPDCSVKKVFEQNLDRHSHEFLSPFASTWIEIVATPLKDSDGKIVAAFEIAIDITEKKLREKELEESQHKFKALFNENPAAICLTDSNHYIVEINSKFTELFGYTPKEIIGKNTFETIIPAEESKNTQTFINKIVNHAISFNTIRKRKDGSNVNVSVSIGPVIVGDKKAGFIGVYNDITDSLLAQRKINKALKETLKAQQQLAESLKKTELLNDKLNVIGSFTRHDVRNKLMTANGNVYLAKKHAKDNPALRANLDQIETANRNIVRILEFAKAYEAIGSQTLAPTNVGKAIDEAVSLFADLNGINIINECSDLNVIADQMLTTIFHNLIDNSLKHGGKLTNIRIYPQKSKNDLKIIYEDDGTGIPQNMKGQLFEKGAGKGTSYGLYLIKRTCEIYGWKAQETGETGKGAKIEFTIR